MKVGTVLFPCTTISSLYDEITVVHSYPVSSMILILLEYYKLYRQDLSKGDVQNYFQLSGGELVGTLSTLIIMSSVSTKQR